MTDDSRVERLLEQLLNVGGTPEEVCRECPELLPQVLNGWRRLSAIQAEIGTLFPDTPSIPTESISAIPNVIPRIRGYDMQEVLGQGGMGVVYKAWHLRLNRAVAIKMLLAGPSARPEELERFLREAEAVAGLHHANIVQVYDVGDMNGSPYFTMEYVGGGSLAQKLTGGPQPAKYAASLLASIAMAIDVAHNRGIIHRDLKPGNILLEYDGTPKITDFGLARRLEAGLGLTLNGAVVGTPNYMAPEQALGQTDLIGPGTDIYALGAILYELLTGRPPFRAETDPSTLQRVLTEDPTPPSQLNRHVPRDLETICLKCLQKDPKRRYASALALSEDLHRFLRGAEVEARRKGTIERGVQWLLRNPALTSVLLIALIVTVYGLWLHGKPSAAIRVEIADVEEILRDVERLQEKFDYADASAALKRAKTLVGPSANSPDLNRTESELRLLERLDLIRLSRFTLAEGREDIAAELKFNNAQADRAYDKLFRDDSMLTPSAPPEDVASRIATSRFRAAFVAALNDWVVCSPDKVRRDWLLKVLRRADPDIWRDHVRDALVWEDGAALVKVAETAPVAQQPTSLLLALAERLSVANLNGTALLLQIAKLHPDDFWANLTLARTLHAAGLEGTNDVESSYLYYEKALAIRPKAVTVYSNLGLALYAKFWLEDDPLKGITGALGRFRQALQIDPDFAPAHNNFGLALKAYGQWEEAVAHYRDALRINPGLAPAHVNIGEIVAGKGQFTEAIDHFEQALRIDPDFARAHYFLGVVSAAKGRFVEIAEIYPKGIQIFDQVRPFALNEALTHYWHALTIDPKWVPARNVLRCSQQETALLNAAIDHFRQAIALQPQLAVAYGALGQALLANWQIGEAESAFKRSLELLPPKQQDLRANLDYLLQRCRQLLVLEGRIPAFVGGTDEPAATEVLDAAELCFVKKQYSTAARLYAEAFNAVPQITEDLRTGHRFNAARAASLAGCSYADDPAKLSEPSLRALRKQAREFLQIDLSAWVHKLDADKLEDRVQAKKSLSLWVVEPDLTGIRDTVALDKLPPEEREECRALWRNVDAQLVRVSK